MDFNFETLKSIGNKLLDVAPSLAGAVLAPNPATVLLALGARKRAVGLSDSATEGDVDTALAGMTPEQRLPLVKAEYDFKTEMGRQDLERFKAALLDTQNARDKAKEETKATGKRDNEDKAFDWTIVIGLFLIIGAMMYFRPPESTILGGLIGTVSTAFIAVVQYRKGTTANSQAKTDMIHNSTPLKPCN